MSIAGLKLITWHPAAPVAGLHTKKERPSAPERLLPSSNRCLDISFMSLLLLRGAPNWLSAWSWALQPKGSTTGLHSSTSHSQKTCLLKC